MLLFQLIWFSSFLHASDRTDLTLVDVLKFFEEKPNYSGCRVRNLQYRETFDGNVLEVEIMKTDQEYGPRNPVFFVLTDAKSARFRGKDYVSEKKIRSRPQSNIRHVDWKSYRVEYDRGRPEVLWELVFELSWDAVRGRAKRFTLQSRYMTGLIWKKDLVAVCGF